MRRRPPRSTRTATLFPYTTLFRSHRRLASGGETPPFGFIARSFRLEDNQVAGLAGERAAERVEGRETDRLGLDGLQDREIGKGDADRVRQFGESHAAVAQQAVEPDNDRHQTVPSRSSPIAAPRSKTSARPKPSSKTTQPKN